MVEMDPDAETFFDTTDDQSMVPVSICLEERHCQNCNILLLKIFVLL